LVFENTTIPLEDDSGNITSCIEIVVDITERKRAEEYLRESRDQTRELFRTSPVPQIIMDPETGVFIQCNVAAIRMFGYENREEVLGKTPTDVSAPIQYDGSESALMVAKHMGACWRDGVHVFEWRYQRPNGQIWDADVQMMLFLYHGKPYMRFTLRDISEHRKTLDALAKAEEKYRAIFDNASIGIYRWSTQKRIVVANPTLTRLFGFDSPQELMDSITDVATQVYVDPLNFTRIRELCLEQGFVNGYETQFCRKDKTPVWVSITMSAIKDGEGNVVHFEGTVQDISDRKQAEEALRWKTALLEAQVNASIDGILVVDENNRRIIKNRRLIELWNVPQHILDDEDDTALLTYIVSLTKCPEEFLRKVMHLYHHPYETGRDEIEFKNGMVLDRYTAPVQDEEGHLYGRIWTFRDITERKRAEEELRESEERFRTLIEGAPEAIFVQTGGRFIYVNPAMVRLLGASRAEELLGNVQFTWIAPEYHEATRARMKLQLETGKPVPPAERVYLRFDGSRVPVESAAVPVRINGVEAHLVFLRDITERKRVEVELRQSEEMYRTLVAASPDAIAVTDLSGRVTLASRKALELCGIPSEEHALGRSILEWVPPDGQIEANAALQQLLATGISLPRELVLRRDDGSLFSAEIHGAPLRSADSIVRGAILIARDVTERNNLQAQLLQSQKMEAIGTLAGGVAHDFNNILTAIMGYAHLMQATMPEGHPVRAYAQEINNCTSKAANVTRSLLAFSRKQTIQLQPNSVNMILRDLEKLLKRLVPEDVTFTMSLHEDMIIMADMTQIDQVLINLASNAKDAMPRGGTLHIETKMVEIGKEFRQAHGFGEPGMYAMISVADTGSGIVACMRCA
jgi:PAS domain S-box-containing protein